MREDTLVEISRSDWITLRDLYKKNWPNHIVGYYTINNYLNWIKIDSNIKHLKLYSLNGDWNDGTFVIVDRDQIFLNTLNSTNDRLTIALSLVDWTYGLTPSTFLDTHRSSVLSVIESKQLKVAFDSSSVLYYLPKLEASNLDIDPPNGIILKALSEEHASMIDEVWPHRHVGSLFFIKRLINWNPNMGAFTTDGKLVAWCLRFQAGPLGTLQVDSTYKRQGLGSLVVKALSKKLGDMDEEVYAAVLEGNIASRKMFEKIGFKLFDKIYWLKTVPLVPFEWADD